MTILLGKTTVTRQRYGAVTVVDHEVVRPAPSELTTQASVQPVNGMEKQNLAEGHRHRDIRKLYSTLEWRTADQHAGTPADRAVIDAVVYEVIQVEPYASLLGHSKVTVARVNE